MQNQDAESRISALNDRLTDAEARAAERPEPDLGPLRQRLDEVEAAVSESSGDPRVDELAGRLGSLESSGPSVDPRLDEVLHRISVLEEQEELGGEPVDTTAIEKRLSALEAEPAGDPSATLVDQLAERLEGLESSGHGADPRLDEVLYRISVLEQQSGLGGEPFDTTAIEKRLSALEAEPAGNLSPALVDQLTERLEAIEKGQVETPPDSAVYDLTRRIAAIEEKAERPTGDAPPDDSRLDEVFARLSDMEDGSREPVPDPRVAELSNRLSAVEQNPREQGIRIDIEDLSRRLEVVESPTDAKNAVADPRVDEMAERLGIASENARRKGRPRRRGNQWRLPRRERYG